MQTTDMMLRKPLYLTRRTFRKSLVCKEVMGSLVRLKLL
jgi:hypothetical protein